ncbi:MAG TPA: GAF domain-containing protein, partial [Leptolyngbyaceae cyanobacterium M65_K2018_010]|nr:GAF domain-containing protein [Leptolyngbyaceae cyanobacterium M65_K2018_010]
MPVASSEFIALCQAQILLLSQTLGASSTVMYLAEASSDSAELSLVPLVVYPETVDPWSGLTESLTLFAEQLPEEVASEAAGVSSNELSSIPKPDSYGANIGLTRTRRHPSLPAAAVANSADQDRHRLNEAASTLPPLVLPLVHEGVALGMMVSTRSSPDWSREERQQAEQVANTLAL